MTAVGPVIEDVVTSLIGIETLAFKKAPVALLEPQTSLPPSVGLGTIEHHLIGERVAIAVSNGPTVFAALLTPAEAETFAWRLLRAAAEAQAEGTA